jgi:predicted RNA binding protein YcfA (HicA-like mRNA interferase family)
VKILCNDFGFHVLRQRGSHVMLIKESKDCRIGVVAPIHDELKIGTLKGILAMAKIKEHEFLEKS